MGLDMYLIPNKKGEKFDYDNKEIAYWRKANAIHNWIFENCALENQHDYEPILVSKQRLIDLKETCQEVLENIEHCDKKTIKVECGWGRDEFGNPKTLYEDVDVFDCELAEELLPTTEGFFFGSTLYDSGYIDDLKDTIMQIDRILEDFDFENDEIYYYASY